MTSGETVTISAYILDDGELSSVTVDGQTPKTLTKHAAGYWKIEIDFTENGTIQVAAQDAAGNRTAHNVEVDWFNTTPSAGASAEVPELEARLTKEDGTELTDEVPFGKDDTAQIRTEAKPSEPGGTVTVTTHLYHRRRRRRPEAERGHRGRRNLPGCEQRLVSGDGGRGDCGRHPLDLPIDRDEPD